MHPRRRKARLLARKVVKRGIRAILDHFEGDVRRPDRITEACSTTTCEPDSRGICVNCHRCVEED
jgi:hypothetical protein